MKNKIIWVDMDEVLVELLDLVLEYNDYKIWEININREDVKDYYIHRQANIWISLDEAVSWFREPMYEDIKNCKMKRVPGSLEKLIELKKDGNKLVIVTARIQDVFWEYTEKWLEMHFPEIFDEIIYTDHFTDKHREKGDVCRELWIEYMIEDNLDYALNLADNWVQTFLLEKPWNKHREENHENIIRISSWEDILI